MSPQCSSGHHDQMHLLHQCTRTRCMHHKNISIRELHLVEALLICMWAGIQLHYDSRGLRGVTQLFSKCMVLCHAVAPELVLVHADLFQSTYVCSHKGQRPGMEPVLGIHSQIHSCIHGTGPGTSAHHSPAGDSSQRCLFVCLHDHIAHVGQRRAP